MILPDPTVLGSNVPCFGRCVCSQTSVPLDSRQALHSSDDRNDCDFDCDFDCDSGIENFGNHDDASDVNDVNRSKNAVPRTKKRHDSPWKTFSFLERIFRSIDSESETPLCF